VFGDKPFGGLVGVLVVSPSWGSVLGAFFGGFFFFGRGLPGEWWGFGSMLPVFFRGF